MLIPMSATLRRNAEIHGAGSPCLIYGDQVLSWGELEARANRRARQFRELGVKPNSFVTIALPNGVMHFECAFAAWKLGATVNPLSAKLPPAEFGEIVKLLDPALLICEPSLGYDDQRVLNPYTSTEGYSAEPFEEAVADHWRALASGGSTGRPKIIVDADNAMWDVTGSSVGHVPGETMLTTGPLYHGAPFIFSNVGLFVGCKVIGMAKFDAEETLRLIERHKVNWICMVPTMMSRISALPEEVRNSYDLSSLRMVWHMAAPMPVRLKEEWIGWLGADKIFEIYTGTERQATTAITGEEWLRKKGSVGKVVSGQMKIIDPEGNECRPGEVGEIFFRAPEGVNSTYAYIGAEARGLPGEWESIGDMGYFDEDGYLFLVDRRTDLILRGGANIYPAEVEAALEHHPAVATAVVVGLPDPDLGRRVHAIVELHQPDRIGVNEIHEFLRSRLTPYKLPESYEIVKDELRNDAGKVRRSALREQREIWLRDNVEFRTLPQKPSI